MKGKGILFAIISCLFIDGFSLYARSESPVAPEQQEERKDVLGVLKKAGQSARLQYNPSGRRDPFQSFIRPDARQLEGLPPLQRVSISQLKLIGVAWSSGGKGVVGAMVQTPDGKSYPVKNGTRIGTNRGRVKSIGAREIIIEEPYLNIFGRTDLKQVAIKLEDKKKEE